MVKNYSKKSKTRKSLIAALCAVTVTCTGLAAACADNDDDDKKPTTEKPVDTQVLKNGNFEFYNTPDEEKAEEGKAIYLIKDADNWTRNGDSSNAKSGVIATNNNAWAALADKELADKLAYNSDLSTSDDEYIDYNGMRARDVLYKDTYAALLENDEVADSYIKYQSFADYFGIVKYNGNYYMNAVSDGNGGYNTENATRVYISDNSTEDEWKKAEFFFDEELKEPVRKELIKNPETHYGTYKTENGKHYLGTREIYLDDDGNYFLDSELKEPCSNILMVHNYPTDSKYNGISQYYSSQTVSLPANTAAEISVWVKTSDLKFDKGYNQIDDQDRGAFIEVVQTVGGSTLDAFKIKAINTEKILRDNPTLDTNNGWLKYTVYVNACDFADSTISLNLGLGQSTNNEKCTGYAFFDDVVVETKSSLEKFEGFTAANTAGKFENTTCTLASEDEEKIFIADKAVRGSANELRNSLDFLYLLDLASENGVESTYEALTLNGAAGGNASAGLTKQNSGKHTYASSLTLDANFVNLARKDADYSDCTLPANLKNNGRNTQNDLAGIFGANDTFTSDMFNGRNYAERLNNALTGENSFKNLPTYTEGESNMLVMLSAYGASYTSVINGFTLPAEGHAIISFWLKTSDLNGGTAATVRVTDIDGDEKSDNISVDTTNIKTKIDDDEDAYNGWVQCFFFVKNDTKTEKQYNLEFGFGNTTLADTALSAYSYGWAAIANIQTLEVPEKIYNVASDGTYLKTYAFTTDDSEKTQNKFDEASGTSNIKVGFANPSSYNGVNGGSSSVSANPYDEQYDARNTNKSAGLINKDTNADVLASVYSAFGAAVQEWDAVFGDKCYQPLIIVNNLREYGEKKAMNYGFIGADSTVSSNSYVTVSVRVMVSEGATAYVYLVDAKTREVLGYSTPRYTFWYDDEGNVLTEEYDADWTTAEHREKIAYTLRKDGLYEDKDKNVYANTHNLTMSYKYYKYEHNKFYDENGNAVSFDDLVDGKKYYSDANHSTVADHFLCNTKGVRVYEFYNGKYYYIVDGERGTEVKEFDKTLARYNNSNLNEEMMVEVGPTGGKWKTVNFVIHAGSETKDYRVELWSGKRGESGESSAATGAVAFDYSAFSVSESNYSTVTKDYTDKIIRAYKNLLRSAGKLDEISSNEENVSFYEELVAKLLESGDITQAQYENAKIPEYTANYYAYTLYDSAAYVPFNGETAKEGETGYDYSVTNDISAEKLAYFTYEDEELNSANVFVDYSAVDQSVSMNSVDDNEEDNDEESETNAGELALYISSIILVVALLITLISLLVRDFLRRRKIMTAGNANAKNNYRQRERYIKKLHLVKNDETEDGEVSDGNTENNSEPEAVEPVTDDIPAEKPAEETSEEVPSEDEKPDEE